MAFHSSSHVSLIAAFFSQGFAGDTDEDRLKNAPGFDTDNWPKMADATWEKSVHGYYGTTY